MRAPLLPPAPVVLSLLVLSSAHGAAGSDSNDTYSGKGEPFSGDHSADGFEVTSRSETSLVSEIRSDSELSVEISHDYVEEYDFESQISGYIEDTSIRVEQVVKPKENKTKSENTTDKPKRKKQGGKKRGNRKRNPCGAKFKNFCIHGECIYKEDMKVVTCKCHPDYFGERCGEKSMKTHSKEDDDSSEITLAAVAVFVSTMCGTIAIIVASRLRKRNFRKYEGEAEEQKKLQQENENAHALV